MNDIAKEFRTFLFGREYRPVCELERPSFSRKALEDLNLHDALNFAPTEPSAKFLNQGHAKAAYDFEDAAWRDTHVVGVVQESLEIKNLTFDNCRIELAPKASLVFTDCSFFQCKITIARYKHEQEVQFNACEIAGSSLTYAPAVYSDSSFDYDDPENHVGTHLEPWPPRHKSVLHLLNSHCDRTFIDLCTPRFVASGGRLDKCRIRGYVGHFVGRSEFRHSDLRTIGHLWEGDNLNMVGGVWAPYVLRNVSLPKATFVETFVDTAQIAKNCSDRSGIDTQRAVVDDSWETLRDDYTGLRYFLHLLFIVMFLLPIVARVALLSSFSHTYIQGAGGTLSWMGKGELMSSPLYELVLFGGIQGPWKYLHCAMTLVLLVYNVIRFYVTYNVGALREREEHKLSLGMVLCRPSDDVLEKLWSWHVRVRLLMLIALIAATWRFISFLLIEVPYFVTS